MSRRSGRLRALALLPVLGVALTALTGCDSKAGVAAVVNGSKISEQTVDSYISQAGPGSGAGALTGGTPLQLKNQVANTLVLTKVYARILAVAGKTPTATELAAAKSNLLGGTTEASLTQQATTLGFTAKYENAVVMQRSLTTVAQQVFSSQAELDAAVKKADLQVSVSPRYGVWSSQGLVGLLKKTDLPSVVTLTSPLPGDSEAATSGQ